MERLLKNLNNFENYPPFKINLLLNSRQQRSTSVSISNSNTHPHSDSGSLSIFISTLFFLTLLFSFESIDIANSYLAQRHLVQIGEAAIQRGAHMIALDRYFSGDLNVERSASDVTKLRVPLDCAGARSAFEQEIQAEKLGARPIATTSWSCINDLLSAQIQADVQPPLIVPFLSVLSNGLITVKASISASSVIGG